MTYGKGAKTGWPDWVKKLGEPYYSSPDRSALIYQADCIEALKKIPKDSIDLIFADPPYFLSDGGITCHAGKMVSVDKGDWDKPPGLGEMHVINLKWLFECQRILNSHGSIWVSGTHHVIFSVGFAMQQLGFKLLNVITWVKPNPPPNLSCRYFTHATEIVLWAAKNEETRHIFNYKEMKEINKGKQMKSHWRDIAPDLTDEWKILPPSGDEKRHGKHPTQKPLALLERIIMASSEPGHLVLDPFMGSGTTGVAAIRLGRKFIGFELKEEFIKVASKRLRDEYENCRQGKLEDELFKELEELSGRKIAGY